ncbi:MAG: hypothetical protein NTW69_01060 [Chloroflexi bacterium]|nr:hypothetical protein [Chloroflexota bacterium]
MDKIWDFPGSKWWRIDFHTHTPASDDYKTKEITPEQWLQRARDARLDAVVVTDHNSGGWIDKLKAANEVMNQGGGHQLTLFPGVEISVADSSNRVHLLAIFDPSCDGQKITAVLGACGISSGFGDDQTTATTTGFIDTVRKITEAGGLAIPAHIDGEKGLLYEISSLTPELKNSLNSVSAAEFCNHDIFDQANFEYKKAVSRLTILAGSDAHNPEEIGRHATWLKMSRLSL